MKRDESLHFARHRRLLFLLLPVTLVTLFAVDFFTGPVAISLKSVLETILHPGSAGETIRKIVLEYRLPKAVVALFAGMALSVSGLQMQTVFRNPLAGPYVLGVSSGASLAVAFFALGFGSIFTAGLTAAGTWSLAVAAWLGAFLSIGLVLFVSMRVNDNTTILILGLLFSAAAGAVVNILQYFSSESMLKAFIVWTMGSLGSITTNQLTVIVPSVSLGCLIALLKMKDLNAFLLGETYARTMGVNIIRSRMVILFSASFLAGTITAFCGPIGFIGIAVPHIARVIFRTSDHRILIPAVLLLGADAMLLSDIISRMPGTNITLPINSVTALLGIPVVVWMIVKNRKFETL